MLDRLLNPIKKKIFLMIGRAIVTHIENSGLTQRVQIIPLANEVCSDVERPQPYGLETYPWHMSENKTEKKFEGADGGKLAESEAVVLFQGGDRSKGLVILISDRYYRPTDLAQGEVGLYTYEDKQTEGHRVHLKADQVVNIKGKTLDIDVTDIDTDVTNNITIDASGAITVTSSGNVTVNASKVVINDATEINANLDVGGVMEATGNVSSNGGDVTDNKGTATTMALMRAIFNGHVHAGVSSGGASTAPPTPPNMGT